MFFGDVNDELLREGKLVEFNFLVHINEKSVNSFRQEHPDNGQF